MHILPRLRELEREFAAELVVIGVHSAKFPTEQVTANLRAAVQRLEVDHPVVNDPDHAIWQQYAVRAWPTLIFTDPRGYVLGKHEGEFSLPRVRELLTELIQRFAADGSLDRSPPPAMAPAGVSAGTLRFPAKVLADTAGQRLFIADTGHHRLLVTDLAGAVQRVIGTGEPGLADGPAATARFHHPKGLTLNDTGDTLFVADDENHAIRAVDLASGAVTTLAGTGEQSYDRQGGGPGRETAISSPWDLALAGDQLWIAMAGSHQLWSLDLATGRIGAAAGTGQESIHDGPLAEATFAQPSGLTMLDGVLYIADSESSAIRRVDPAADRVRRLLGQGLFIFGDADGRGDQARLQHPLGVAAVSDGDATAVYLADTYNHKIKRLDPATRQVETVTGGEPGNADGDLATARFWEPSGLSLAGRQLYVADTNNHALRVIDLDAGQVRTLKVSDS